MSDVQAAEIKLDGAIAWGVQYHPEFSLGDMAAIVRRYGRRLIGEGFFADEAARDAYVADLETLDREPANKPLAWRYGIDETVLEPARPHRRDRELDHASGAADAGEQGARMMDFQRSSCGGDRRDRRARHRGGGRAAGGGRDLPRALSQRG